MALPSFLSPFHRGAVILVFLTSVLLSVFIWRYAVRQDQERVRSSFLSRAQTQASVANLHLHAYEEMIHSLRDSFLGQESVERKEFNRIAQSMLQRHPGVQALQWVQIVPDAQRAEFERLTATQLGRPFAIRQRRPDDSLAPAPVAPEYFAITYVEPIAGNEPVVGYDVLSAPSAPLLRAARADGGFKVSQTFRLAQSAPGESMQGVVFILPFARAEPADSPVEGFIQGVFTVHTLLAQSHNLTTNEALDTYYFDTTEGDPVLLYANLAGREPLREAGPMPPIPHVDDKVDFQAPLTLGDRTWKMVIRPNARWARATSSRQPVVILLAGLVISVMFTGFVNNLFQRTALVEQQVRERTRELRASEARLQDIVDHSPAIIFLKDLEGRHLMCNEPFARFSQRNRSEIIGRTDHELFSPAQADSFRASDEAVLRDCRPVQFEQAVEADGRQVICIVQKFPLLDDQGKAYALCGIATDITERKASEVQRLTLERQLLESQKLESLGVLAGGVAHDFNNILTSILGNATLGAMDLPENHRSRKYLQQIERASQRAADLCSQMLAYAGKASFVTAPLSLSALVHDTAALLEVSVGKCVRLELVTDPGAPHVMGDVTQLRQIVMNLVINAADAMGNRTDGHIVVRTYARDLTDEFLRRAVQSPRLPSGLYVGLEVQDNGSGMAPEVRARIFEPFFTTKFSGRGLGLAAVLGIVQSHDGALFVESEPGRGTTFRLFLPATAAQLPPAIPSLPLPPGALRGTVLVVDDEEPVRYVAEDVLTQLGLTVLLAPDGPAAIDLVRTHDGRINLVLLDLTMPGLAGDETLRELRQIRPDLCVIIMSGYSEGEIMSRCASLGVAGYLPKPFELAALTHKIRPFLT